MNDLISSNITHTVRGWTGLEGSFQFFSFIPQFNVSRPDLLWMCDGVNSPVMLPELIIHHQPAFDTSFIQLEIRHAPIFFKEQMSQSTAVYAVTHKHHSDLLCNATLLRTGGLVALSCSGFDHCEFDSTVCV